jgi:hypothetical protein
MESLLFVFLGVGSLFSLSNALKCYVCLGFVGKQVSKTDDCAEGTFNSSALTDFEDGLYCFTHKQELSLAKLNDVLIGTKRGAVTRNETGALNLDGKCFETGPGAMQNLNIPVLKSSLCYCRTDGCNGGRTPHRADVIFLSIILAGFVFGLECILD